MRLVACTLVLLVACNQGEGEDYYIEPGGGNGTFGTSIGSADAGTTDGSTATRAGRVCGLSEILDWGECDQIGLDGLLVSVGGAQSTTSGNGAFTIAEPSGSNLVWRASGNAQFASLREFPGDNIIPSISLALYQDLAAEAGVVIGNNVGTIFVQVISSGQPLQNASGALAGLQDLVRYDDPNGSAKFSVGATREAGMIWFPNVTPGSTVTFTVTPPVAVGAPKDTVVTVETDTATFATVVFQSPSM